MSQLSSIGFGQCVNLAIACYLIQEANADINLRNRKGKTPLDVLEAQKLVEDGAKATKFNFDAAKEFIIGLIESRTSRSETSHVVGGTNTKRGDDALNGSQSDAESTAPLVNSTETPTSFVVDISSNDKPRENSSQSSECIICNELKASVVFEPCNHILLCELCSVRIKKCIKCHQLITAKVVVKQNNRQLTQSNNISDQTLHSKVGNNSNTSHTSVNNRNNHNNNNNQKVSVERLKYLESKIAEIEEANSCTICMIPYTHNGVLRMAFLCGHSACYNCAQTLKTCHMCRKTITRKINLY